MLLKLTLNGRAVSAEAATTASLLDVLRDSGLTGTKEGCRVGVCGLCTVIVDDKPVSSCLYLAACAQDADVWTVEGIAERQPELIGAFVAADGMQCGICTPGQIVTVASMGPEVQGEQAVRRYLSGNLCRCTGYVSIVAAACAYQAARRSEDRRDRRGPGCERHEGKDCGAG
ncbi:MAG: (2Fe-2S)-binding protein [Streptosporangiaceae bacterium]